jgi:hypothetical protein
LQPCNEAGGLAGKSAILQSCEASDGPGSNSGRFRFSSFFTSAGTSLAEHSAAQALPGGFFLPAGDKAFDFGASASDNAR